MPDPVDPVLRRLAEAAQAEDEQERLRALMAFLMALTPSAVLALLDRIDALEAGLLPVLRQHSTLTPDGLRMVLLRRFGLPAEEVDALVPVATTPRPGDERSAASLADPGAVAGEPESAPAAEEPDSPHIFRDPISGQECELRIGIGVDRLRPGLPGAAVVHGECRSAADVSPDLDAFYCPTCRWSGRVSGAWVMDLLDPLYDLDSEAAGGSAPESETTDA